MRRRQVWQSPALHGADERRRRRVDAAVARRRFQHRRLLDERARLLRESRLFHRAGGPPPAACLRGSGAVRHPLASPAVAACRRQLRRERQQAEPERGGAPPEPHRPRPAPSLQQVRVRHGPPQPALPSLPAFVLPPPRHARQAAEVVRRVRPPAAARLVPRQPEHRVVVHVAVVFPQLVAAARRPQARVPRLTPARPRKVHVHVPLPRLLAPHAPRHAGVRHVQVLRRQRRIRHRRHQRRAGRHGHVKPRRRLAGRRRVLTRLGIAIPTAANQREFASNVIRYRAKATILNANTYVSLRCCY